MKKLFIITLLSFQFFSCSTSSSDEPQEEQFTTNGTLLRRSITSSGSTIIEDANYFYDGNKLTKIKRSNTDYTSYTYTNNLITKAERYINSSLSSTGIFSYDSNEKLIQSLTLSNQTGIGYKVVYNLNTDGTVSVTEYKGDLINQNTVQRTFKVFFQNGLVSKREEYNLINGNMETLTTDYTYDTKNDPHNSILGFNKLTFYEVTSVGNPNNIVSLTYSATNSANITQGISNYTYNSYNYPITKTDTNSNGQIYVSQFYYQQN